MSDEPIVVAGHSFGGYTVLALSGAPYDTDATPDYDERFAEGFLDERVAATIAMAPGDADLFGDLHQIAVPVLHMTAELDPSPNDAYWERLQGGDNRRVALTGGGHQSFTDFADQLEDVPLDRDEGFTIVDAYVQAWLERTVHADAAYQPILDGDVPIALEASPTATRPCVNTPSAMAHFSKPSRAPSRDVERLLAICSGRELGDGDSAPAFSALE